ncbi:hypothetical protein [Pseudomonas sp.]|uniref:hypothetical protein n=1 Tax=Pseudomonas sp. TaxID=306 RepID=UPI0028AB6D2E|nr:hypothetical protein [Pseudomonas sp.]
MDGLEFSAKLIEAVVWPVTLATTAVVMYWKRQQSGAFFGEFFKRLREFSVGSVKVTLAETSSPVALSADIKSAHFRRYTNGVIVQQISLQSKVAMRFPLTFPVAFPNEVLSFQFVDSQPYPIREVRNGGFVLDLTGQPTPISVNLIISGL